MTPFQARIHDVSGALAQLQIEILERLASCPPGGSDDARAMDSILEATTALRDAFDHFVQATVVTTAPEASRLPPSAWGKERA